MYRGQIGQTVQANESKYDTCMAFLLSLAGVISSVKYGQSEMYW